MGFPRQKWCGMLFPSPGHLPNPGIEPRSPTLADRFFNSEPPGLLLLSRFSRVRLCDPIDGSPSGSSVQGIFQARGLEWGAITFFGDTRVSLGNCCCSVTQSCLIVCSPMGCNPPGSSVDGIFQARILEWVAISNSR